jgi:hypothetical protein
MKLHELNIFRCSTCRKLIRLAPSILDDNGNLVPFDFDSERHVCFDFDVIEEKDKLTINRLIEEVFLILIRHKYLDRKTGVLKRTYEEQARTLAYKSTQVFTVHLSHIQDNKIKQELSDLVFTTFDYVIREVIERIFESVASERQYNLSIRNLLQWEIGA